MLPRVAHGENPVLYKVIMVSLGGEEDLTEILQFAGGNKREELTSLWKRGSWEERPAEANRCPSATLLSKKSVT